MGVFGKHYLQLYDKYESLIVMVASIHIVVGNLSKGKGIEDQT